MDSLSRETGSREQGDSRSLGPTRYRNGRATTRLLRGLAVVAAALVLGTVGLSLMLTDLGPGESPEARVATIAALFFLGGAVFGLLHPEGWWLAGTLAWSAVLLGVTALVSAVAAAFGAEAVLGALAIVLVPLGLALSGSYLGMRLRRAGVVRAALGRLRRRR